MPKKPQSKNLEDFSHSIKTFFPTPVMQHQFSGMEAINTDIKRLLLEKEQQQPERNTGDAQKSNIAGWRSSEDLISWPEPAIKDLAMRVAKAAEAMLRSAPNQKDLKGRKIELRAWANINREGSYNAIHMHPGHHFAAVYYVSVPEPNRQNPRSGVLEFQEPRSITQGMPVPGFAFGKNIGLQPKEGMLVMFPAWLMHHVHPLSGEGERISIAFNIRLQSAK